MPLTPPFDGVAPHAEVREELIAVRDAALTEADFTAAVFLSHVIGWMSTLADAERQLDAVSEVIATLTNPRDPRRYSRHEIAEMLTTALKEEK